MFDVFSQKNRILLRELIKTDFKLRYQGSAIGYLWSILKPLMMFSIMYVVFVRFLRFDDGTPHYAVGLLLSMIFWSFFNNVSFGIHTLVIIPLFIEILFLSLGFAFILSALFVKYRDIGPVWEVVLQAGMYASPIIYSITYLLQRNHTDVAKLLMMNPIAQILQDMRHYIIDPVNPRGWDLFDNKLIACIPYCIPIVIFIIGVIVFNRNSKRFAEIL